MSAICCALLAPLLIADVPPILDYPNHLARLVLLAAGPNDPVLGPIFVPRWTIIPNLAIDLIGPPLVAMLPVHFAGRLLLAFMLLLNLGGVIALHRAYFGRVSPWPLGGALAAYSLTFLLGFLNWQIASGLAMLAAAGWLMWRERYQAATIAASAGLSAVLFFCHLSGVGFFLVLIGSAELSAMIEERRVVRRALALLPAVTVPLLLSLMTDLRDLPTAIDFMPWRLKLEQFAAVFLNYNWTLDIVTTVAIFGGIGLGLATGRVAIAPRARFAVAGLLALYAVVPFDLKSASFTDTRVAVMVGLMAFAAFDFQPGQKMLRRVVCVGVALLFVVRAGVVTLAWWDHRADLAGLRTAIAPIAPGSRVYVVNVAPQEAPSYWAAGPRSRRLSNTLRAEFHMAALVLIERGAFWPVLFANPAQQPIALRPAYARLARQQERGPSHAAFVAHPTEGLDALGGFDYVLMLEAGADPDLQGFVPACLRLLTRSDFAAVFEVTCRRAVQSD